MSYKAIIAGATGLIGSHLLNILLNNDEYTHVVSLVRKNTGIAHHKLREVVVDFDKLNEYEQLIAGHAIFCCLGSTQKKTPDLKAYYKIDHDYPLQLAQLAFKNGVEQYHLISSMGANSGASNFYLKTKGEAEEDIIQTGVNCLHIYRPAFLTGDRKEYRFAEKILTPFMAIINPLLIGGMKKYRSIPAQTVAMAMYNESLKNNEGVFIHPSDNIKQIA
jgi:uncharacterized protein YbjT (DUF2867 family)